MSKHYLLNGRLVTVSDSQWNGDSLVFAGSSYTNGQMPTVTFAGENRLTTIVDRGSTAAHGYGAINLMPGGSLKTGGMTLSNATLSVNERPGSHVTFNGTSRVSYNSTLTATGYGGTGQYTVNGTMKIDGTSVVNMNYVAVDGTGTFHLTGATALLRVGSVGAGETVVLDGGKFSLTNGMHFLGTITDSAPAVSRIGLGTSVDVYNAFDAVRESFNRSTGALSLFNAAGTEVAHLKFAGTGDLYAAPTSGLATNFISISSQHTVGALPVTFTS
jgi:hypothetical protein